jgi:hypothetical protein
MERGQRRKLVQLLVTESGSQVIDFQSPATHDELLLEKQPLWRPRRIRVRIVDRPVEQTDVTRLAEIVAANTDAEGLLFAPLGMTSDIEMPDTVMLIGPAEMISRMERCSMIAWPDGSPAPAYDRLALQRDLDRDAFLLDPVGLRWLPSLALNELPTELAGRHLVPDALFERMAFRLFSSTLRFGGVRYGEAARGQRLPDALLTFPGPAPVSAIMDCKASADGYTMDSDHYLRFVGYVSTLRAGLDAEGGELRYLIVLSSSFAGTRGARHPYHARASALLAATGVQLVYLRAAALARTAALVEGRGMSPSEREELNWMAVFDHGLVESSHLDAILED